MREIEGLGAERSSPPDFGAIERQQNIDNLQAMASEIADRSRRLSERVSNWAARVNLPEARFWEALEADPGGPLAAMLAMEARRQNVHEKAVADYVASLSLVAEFSKLPSSGNNACYINADGLVVTGSQLAGATKPSKSLDFRWVTGVVTCYAAQKYTKEGGGNQDSQYNEVQRLLRNFQQRTTNDTALIILVDGDYYTEERIALLRQLTRSQSPRSYVTGVAGLPQLLAQIEN